MYINTETLEYPISEQEIKNRFKDTSLPENFVSWEKYYVVYETAQPSYDDKKQKIEQVTPVLKDGKWVQSWKVVNLTAEEIKQKYDADFYSASQSVREERNSLLRDSDWTQLADSTANKTSWSAYRQQLRNITEQSTFPWQVTWPQKPTE